MARRRKKQLPVDPVRTQVESLDHEGRGVAHIDGKVVFIAGALAGEEVMFTYTSRRRNFDEGTVSEVITASPDRVEPRCAHFGVCGGCSLQHVSADAQVAAKQRMLLDNLERIGKVSPENILPPLTGKSWGYRRRARLGVKYVRKKEKVLVGFRERRKPYIAELERCEVLHPSVGSMLVPLAGLVRSLSVYDKVPQIEVACGDDCTVLVFRHMEPLTDKDKEKLLDFGLEHDLHMYVQPAGPDSVVPLALDACDLTYALHDHQMVYEFLPTDFTQVNADINRQMVNRALTLLDLKPTDKVLDLFCGLGNFTLPIARHVAAVTGVEGEAGLIARARENAARNNIDNASFHVANLEQHIADNAWFKQQYDKILIDPARTGALEVVEQIDKLGADHIVYVSCNPATLARDADVLVNQKGYTLQSAGVMDMFPHTTHVEAIALFVK